MLYDPYLRSIISPTRHIIRDWMHTCVSNGIAGTEMMMLFIALDQAGVQMAMVCAFAEKFVLPKKWGRVNPAWFKEDNLTNEGLRCFASEQLNMLPIVDAFLAEVVRPLGLLRDHCRCFELLHRIIAIFSLGPEKSMVHLDDLRRSIVAHHELFTTVYPKSACKPKWHQLLHVPENMMASGSLVSCFPTERKHSSVKMAAKDIFRYFEGTLLIDLVSRQLHGMQEASLYKDISMVAPTTVQAGGMELQRSSSANLPSGEVKAGDYVWLQTDAVSEVVCFWGNAEGSVLAAVIPWQRGTSSTNWIVGGGEVAFIDAADIVCPLVWALRQPGVIRVCVPVVR